MADQPKEERESFDCVDNLERSRDFKPDQPCVFERLLPTASLKLSHSCVKI